MNIFNPHTKAESAKINENFSDLSTGLGDVDNNRLQLFRAEATFDFIASGLAWSIVSGLNCSMTSGVAYIKDTNGYTQRISVATITSRTFTASKDTYVDLGSDGVVYYTEVANGATTGFGIVNGRVRIAKIVSGASTITSVSISGWDVMGEEIRPRSTAVREQNYYFNSGSQIISAASGMTDITNAVTKFIKKKNGALKVRLSGSAYKTTNVGGSRSRVSVNTATYLFPNNTGWKYFYNTLSDHRAWSWEATLYDIPAGSYSFQIQLQCLVDSIQIDTEDNFILTITEM